MIVALTRNLTPRAVGTSPTVGIAIVISALLGLGACSGHPRPAPDTTGPETTATAGSGRGESQSAAQSGSAGIDPNLGHPGAGIGAAGMSRAANAAGAAADGDAGAANTGTGAPMSQQPAQPGPCMANAFALGDVSLETSDFTANRDRTLAYLRAIDTESLLYNFRAVVGLPTNKAAAPSGWEAPDSNLRGHATGHVLKALAQAYAGTHDTQYKTKADNLVAELKKCQELAESKSFGAGYLGAYPPDQFVKLESLATYPTIWAPYYTMHKILAGLIASYQLTGNASALEMAKKLATWTYQRLSKLPRGKLQDMWNLYIAGETGGMNDSLAELYKISGDKMFLDTAVLFDKDQVLDSCAADQDKLGGLHANQHIPTIAGYLRIYDGNGSDKYLSAAQNFWSMVTRHHAYVIGGTGDAEMFKPADQIGSALTAKTCETCATYNMLKLTRQLFCHNPDAKYMDYYERGLFNHILGSQDPTSKNAAVTYFVPLNPGAQRTYNNTFTCCHGTGMENHTKYQEQIYSYSSDASMLYVNLYIASTLHWNDKGFTITQTTRYPYEPSSRLVVSGSGPLKIAVRVPGWAAQGVQVLVNGEPQNVSAQPGSYAVVDRTWVNGDALDVRFTFAFRIESPPDDKTLGAILYGPTVLVATSNKTSTMTLKLDPKDLASGFVAKDMPLTFTSNDLTFEPFSKATNTAYHTYFKF